eukprot:Lankesteria_metandrocarpae@DN9296_c0_g1_i1.p1
MNHATTSNTSPHAKHYGHDSHHDNIRGVDNALPSLVKLCSHPVALSEFTSKLLLQLNEVSTATTHDAEQDIKRLPDTSSKVADYADVSWGSHAYYLQPFATAVTLVNKYYKSLFTTEEISVIHRFLALSSNGKKLFACLYRRCTGPWFEYSSLVDRYRYVMLDEGLRELLSADLATTWEAQTLLMLWCSCSSTSTGCTGTTTGSGCTGSGCTGTT